MNRFSRASLILFLFLLASCSDEEQSGLGLVTKACLSGGASACTAVGIMYKNGKDVEKDLGKSRQFFELGCGGGQAKACHEFGHMMRDGIGGDKNPEKALKLLELACSGMEEKYSQSCYSVGLMHSKGIGTSKNNDVAWEWLWKPCPKKIESADCRMAERLSGLLIK